MTEEYIFSADCVRRFQKKPVVIEAYRISDDLEERRLGYNWIVSRIGEVDPFDHENKTSGVYIDPGTGDIMIITLEGVMRAVPGDWIIRGVMGEFYPCKPHVFASTYQEV